MVGLDHINFIDERVKANPHKKRSDINITTIEKTVLLALPMDPVQKDQIDLLQGQGVNNIAIWGCE